MLLFHLFSKTQREHPPIKKLIALCLWLIISLLVFIVCFKFLESVGWQEATWQVWQTATTVGYGNRPAQTIMGQWATIIFGLLCISLLGTGISAVFEAKAYLKDRERYGLMKNPIKNGYILFNFPSSEILGTFIKEIRFIEKEVGICIVDENLEELPTSIAATGNIHFIRGEVLDKSTYEKAALVENKIVVVFPTDANSPKSDGITKTIVDLVLKFVDGNNTRVVYSLVKTENAWMFDSRATGTTRNLDTLALVQECQDVHSARAYETLLKNTEGPNPQTVVPHLTVGFTWRKFVEGCTATSGKWGILMTPLALIHKGKVQVCPPLDMTIQEGDVISIVAYEGFSWSFFERQVAFFLR